MKLRIAFILVITAVFASALLSCDGGSIYATIATEKRVDDNTLPKTLSVPNIAMTSSGNYFLAAGAVFHGTLTAGTVTWTPNNATSDRPNNPTNGLCSALAYDGTALWGGFITTGGNIGLMSALVANPLAWTVSPQTASGAKQVTMLRMENSNLLMSTATVSPTSPVYALDYYDGSWHSVTTPALTAPVLGVAYDGSSYFALTSSAIYKGGAVGNLSALATLPTLATSGDTYRDIFADPVSGRVFVATKKSGISMSTNGGATWTPITAALVSNATVGFLTVAGPVNAGGNLYLAGSDGYGYYTLNATAKTLTRYPGSTINLYSASVSSILVDGANVLMGTNSRGLWRTTFDPGKGDLAAGKSWIHE